MAQALCAAVAARLHPRAPAVSVEVTSLQPNAVTARLGVVTGGGLHWGEPVTQAVIDRETLPAGAVERLAGALLKLAAEALPAALPLFIPDRSR